MAVGLCSVLRSFLVLQARLRISVHIDHVPGISNDVADSLSRGTDPVSLGFSPSENVTADWTVLSNAPNLSLHSSAAAFFWGGSPGGSSTWLDQVWSDRRQGSASPDHRTFCIGVKKKPADRVSSRELALTVG